jgi:hypothetical protein
LTTPFSVSLSFQFLFKFVGHSLSFFAFFILNNISPQIHKQHTIRTTSPHSHNATPHKKPRKMLEFDCARAGWGFLLEAAILFFFVLHRVIVAQPNMTPLLILVLLLTSTLLHFSLHSGKFVSCFRHNDSLVDIHSPPPFFFCFLKITPYGLLSVTFWNEAVVFLPFHLNQVN